MQSFEFLSLLKATWETIYIVFIASSLSIFFGAILGTFLFLTKKQQPLAHPRLHQILGVTINMTRSVPFIILMISILPLTRFLVGTTIGTNAAIVPLTIAAIPFFARVCEGALAEVPYGLIETANSLGATTYQIVTHVLLPESLPALIRGMTLTIIALIGYSTMAGAVGGGGLGELAINYGYQRFNMLVTLETVIVLIVLVQLIQYLGDRLAMKRRFKPILFGSMLLALLCIGTQGYSYFHTQSDTLKVGVTAGWPEDVMQVAKSIALKKYHLNIEVVPFNDYVLPNTALANGNIDANIFQHFPYLEEQIKTRHYALTPIAKTFVYPMGFYSLKIKNISELPHQAIVALPNDPSNEARSLLLLAKMGLIKLDQPHQGLVNMKSISKNPKQLRFKLLDAAQLPRVLKDADLVALTNDFVGPAGFSIREALLKEGADSNYANIIVVRSTNKNDARYQTLITIMHSQAVIEATQAIFPDGAAIPAWKGLIDFSKGFLLTVTLLLL